MTLYQFLRKRHLEDLKAIRMCLREKISPGLAVSLANLMNRLQQSLADLRRNHYKY